LFFLSARIFKMAAWLVRLAVPILLSLMGLAQAVSYTVQVVAVSSQENALAFQEYLNDQGFPAYLVSVPTTQGYIFRIRVGSFANRAAASAFAEAMQGILDSSPSPALAEGIPEDLVPLEVALLSEFSLDSQAVAVIPWQDGFAVRSQPHESLEPAHYILSDLTEFAAWWAEPGEDGSILRLVNQWLWPEAYQIKTPTELEEFRQQMLDQLATELNLAFKAVEAYQVTNQIGVPMLILLERWNPVSGEIRHLRALGKPADDPAARYPELDWFSGETEVNPATPEILFDPHMAVVGDEPLRGTSWQAKSDEEYARLETSGKNWRAAVGKPVWASGSFLMTQLQDKIYLYHIQVR
jgi:hypothetical protein